MRPRTAAVMAVALVAAALGGADCGPGPSAADAGPPDAGPPPPPCADPGVVYGIGRDQQPFELGPGASLPLFRGFQGFIFARVGLRTPMPLPDQVTLVADLSVPDKAELSNAFSSVPVHPRAGGSETGDINFVVNDVPLAQLVGQAASLRVAASTGSCLAVAEVQVVLVSGGSVGADGGDLPGDGGDAPGDGRGGDGGVERDAGEAVDAGS